MVKFDPDKKLHSREHVLAEDLSQMLGEPKRFGAYLGIAGRYEERDLRAIARMVREKDDLPPEARGKYFFACLRGLPLTREYVLGMRAKKRKLAYAKKRKNNAKRSANHKGAASRAATKSTGDSAI